MQGHVWIRALPQGGFCRELAVADAAVGALVPLLCVPSKDLGPVVFHVDDDPASFGCVGEGGDKLAGAFGFGVVSVLAVGICVVDNDTQGGVGIVDRGVFEHLPVAVTVAEASDGAAADELMNSDGFIRFVVDEEVSHRFDQNGAVLAQFINGAGVGADDLFRRNAVHPFAEDPHKVGASAGDNEGFEFIGAEVGQKFEHRPVSQPVVGLIESRMSGRGEPVADPLRKFDRCQTGARQAHDMKQAFVMIGKKGRQVAIKGRYNHGVVFPGWFVRTAAFEFIESEGELERHRIFRPKGAVVVKDRDTLGCRNEMRRSFVRYAGDEVGNRALCFPFPP